MSNSRYDFKLYRYSDLTDDILNNYKSYQEKYDKLESLEKENLKKAYDYLLTVNAPFIFDAGSSTVALSGNNPLRDNGNWNIGFKNPSFTSQELLFTIQVSGNTFVSTSGDYQKYFYYEQDGKEQMMHHILDVDTGIDDASRSNCHRLRLDY